MLLFSNSFNKVSNEYFFLIAGLWLPSLIKAQASRDSVIAVIRHLFDAMRDADVTRLKACFTENAVLQTVIHTTADTIKVRTDGVDAFATIISKEARGSADEKVHLDAIHIDGALASVWAPYSFYYKGKFSHCGVNSFQLVRKGSGWKIQYLIDTRRKEGCNNP